MKLKKNTVNNLLLLLLLVLFLSCENRINRQKVKVDGKSKKIEILSDEFVFDSIIIENGDGTFFSAYLTNKKAGTNIFYLGNKSERNYVNSLAPFLKIGNSPIDSSEYC